MDIHSDIVRDSDSPTMKALRTGTDLKVQLVV
jgi:hypothetical protein